MKKIFLFFILLCSISFFTSSLIWAYFGPSQKENVSEIFIVPQDQLSFNLVDELYNKGYIKNKKGFSFLLTYTSENYLIKPGGYKLSSKMNAWQTIKKITGDQDLLWVSIYFCPRKEQVGERLANILGWDESKLNEWNTLFTNTEYFEGVYYPETYLIPKNDSVKEVAQRFINKFNEKISTLSPNFQSKDIKWTTGIKIASLIAREAAGKEDAKLISGIIWNRLNQNMRLQIDSTMQYTLGKNQDGSWWGPIDLKQKQINSPYNSYKNEGLPPTPICSPNIDFIEAALNPIETDCIFYLHDTNREIHCAKTYAEHKANIDKYLN